MEFFLPLQKSYPLRLFRFQHAETVSLPNAEPPPKLEYSKSANYDAGVIHILSSNWLVIWEAEEHYRE